MALVSGGMGEAILGIVNKGQDGGVFTGLKTEKIAVCNKDIILGHEHRDDNVECRRVMEDHVVCAEDANGTGAVELMHPSHLMHVRLKTGGIISNGKATRHINGAAVHVHHPSESCTCIESKREVKDIAAAVNRRSHVNGTRSSDHLVERAIQCLDEKVLKMYVGIYIFITH